MPTFSTLVSSFNAYPKQFCNLHRPEKYRDLLTIPPGSIARGQGKSYGDAALNEHGNIVLTERLNRFIAFDPDTGVLTAEAGITLAKIIQVISPLGWFLPVTPGTQHVSLGGCIAADVHGKNHHHQGTFSSHILWLELITVNKQVIRCSSQENSEIFWATVGGMGLTGIIGMISLKLLPIESNYLTVTCYPTQNLTETLAHLTQEEFADDYLVSWLDLLTPGKKFGRGIVMAAHHTKLMELPSSLQTNPLTSLKTSSLRMPFTWPTGLLNQTTGKFLNQIYYSRNNKRSTYFANYLNYFYPLDSVKHWERIYGKKGFVQYQCVFPQQAAEAGLIKLLHQLKNSAYPAFLGTLKRFSAENNSYFSFPLAGISIALDLPILDDGLFLLLNKFDDIVAAYGGRVYLAKDARLTPHMFQQMYPRYKEWLTIKTKIDPEKYFTSSLGKRLDL